MPSWFTADNFRCEQLVEAWELTPHIPQRLSKMNMFRSIPSIRTSVAVEYKDGVVTLVSSQPRGQHNAEVTEVGKRHLVSITIPHFPRKFSVVPDELPDIRRFGTVDGATSVNAVIAEKLAQERQNYALTDEFLQLGALRGIVKDADGSTLLDMFNLFGLTQDAVNVDLGATPDNMEAKCATILRTMAKNAGGSAFGGVHAFCGDAYFDALVALEEVRTAYDRWMDGEFLREGHVYRSVMYKKILFENYAGYYGSSNLIGDDEAIYFPTGADVYREYRGPADGLNSVGRVGRDMEITSHLMPHDLGIEYRMQQNKMYFVRRPKMLIKSTATYPA